MESGQLAEKYVSSLPLIRGNGSRVNHPNMIRCVLFYFVFFYVKKNLQKSESALSMYLCVPDTGSSFNIKNSQQGHQNGDSPVSV